MLQKMGWKEGHGLGSLGKGIREPVSVYGMARGTLGCLGLGLYQSIQPGHFLLAAYSGAQGTGVTSSFLYRSLNCFLTLKI